MTITIDRSVCCDLNETLAREWLVTNGLGGYAAGTIAGVLTRKQHGLLVAMLPDAEVPQLLLAKIDEEVFFDQRTYYLGTNEYQDGTCNPAGFVHLESFRLENGMPIFTYRLGGIDGLFLEKRIWMAQGQNTTFVQYRVLRTTTTEKPGFRRSGITGMLSTLERHTEPSTPLVQTQQALTLTLLPLAAFRPYNQHQYGNLDLHYQVQVYRDDKHPVLNNITGLAQLSRGSAGCSIQPTHDARPYHILAVGRPESEVTFVPTGVWYWHFLHRHHRALGDMTTDDFYLPGVIRTTLYPGEDPALTIIISSEDPAHLPVHHQRLHELYHQNHEQQKQRIECMLQPTTRFFGEGGEAAQAYHLRSLPLTTASDPYKKGHELLALLLQASERFFIQNPNTHSQSSSFAYTVAQLSPTPMPVGQKHAFRLISDYFTQAHSLRDMLIALPGLLLVTRHTQEAQQTLRHLARYFMGGLLPERLPTRERPLRDDDYGSVDLTLWFFYALDYYWRTTHDNDLLEELFPHLKECINRYVHGTYHEIRVDPADGLLIANHTERAQTWMNAYAHGQPVTTRSGKAVEVNALWYHALSLMHEWSHYLNQNGARGHGVGYYQRLLLQCEQSFQQRFWYNTGGYLYDVIDGIRGDDATLRPNQVFALSLRYPVLRPEYRQRVIEKIKQHLLTRYGLRTLSPADPQYRGQLDRASTPEHQQQALHQGSTWPWLIGPYIDATLAQKLHPTDRQEQHLFQERLWREGVQQLGPFHERLTQGVFGMCERVLAGNAPHNPAMTDLIQASALSIGELLRCYHMLAQLRAIEPERVLSY